VQDLVNYLGMRFDYSRELIIIALIMSRILPITFLCPFMAGQAAPSEVKMGLAAVFTILIWPLARESMTANLPMNALPVFLLMMKETLIGFAIGFSSGHIFYVMEIAGRMIDTARGSAQAEVMVPASRGRSTMVGSMYSQLLLVFFCIIGGHHVFIDTLFFSFGQIPINETIDLTPGLSPVAIYSIRLTADILMSATILATPALAATFITDIVFGILNRVAPQLNAYFMAMPVKAMGALALVLLAMPPFLGRLTIYIESSLVAAKRTLDLMTIG
jgi:flagellar biosynthetic protein FliR